MPYSIDSGFNNMYLSVLFIYVKRKREKGCGSIRRYAHSLFPFSILFTGRYRSLALTSFPIPAPVSFPPVCGLPFPRPVRDAFCSQADSGGMHLLPLDAFAGFFEGKLPGQHFINYYPKGVNIGRRSLLRFRRKLFRKCAMHAK